MFDLMSMNMPNMMRFKLERDGNIVDANIAGFMCSSKYPDSIQTKGRYKILVNDVLVHDDTNQRFIIDQIKPLTSTSSLLHYHQGESPKNQPVQNISISSIAGNAIVGSQQTATINDGMSFEEITAMIANLKDISDEDKACLQQFASSVEALHTTGLLERLGPVLSGVLQPIVAWLLPK